MSPPAKHTCGHGGREIWFLHHKASCYYSPKGGKGPLEPAYPLIPCGGRLQRPAYSGEIQSEWGETTFAFQELLI